MLIRKNFKRNQRIIFNRRLIDKIIQRKMTIGIAAICDSDDPKLLPKIIFCADRLVSVGVQFEGGSAKIKYLTPYCYALYASNDSLRADQILKKALDELLQTKETLEIEAIANLLSNQCKNFKNEYYEDTVLSKYNLTQTRIHAEPNMLAKDAIEEIKNTPYPFEMELIVLGLDTNIEDAHIFTINQDGKVQPWDSIGFATIGSGGELAFLEMTKHYYAKYTQMTYALARVYFSKKISERAEGVGRYTDLRVLYFGEGKDGKLEPRLSANIPDTALGIKLNEVYDKLFTYEKDQLASLTTELNEMIEQEEKTRTKTETELKTETEQN